MPIFNFAQFLSTEADEIDEIFRHETVVFHGHALNDGSCFESMVAIKRWLMGLIELREISNE